MDPRLDRVLALTDPAFLRQVLQMPEEKQRAFLELLLELRQAGATAAAAPLAHADPDARGMREACARDARGMRGGVVPTRQENPSVQSEAIVPVLETPSAGRGLAHARGMREGCAGDARRSALSQAASDRARRRWHGAPDGGSEAPKSPAAAADAETMAIAGVLRGTTYRSKQPRDVRDRILLEKAVLLRQQEFDRESTTWLWSEAQRLGKRQDAGRLLAFWLDGGLAREVRDQHLGRQKQAALAARPARAGGDPVPAGSVQLPLPMFAASLRAAGGA